MLSFIPKSLFRQSFTGLFLVFILLTVLVPFSLSGQTQAPVAVRDTASVRELDTVFVDVLNNDYDPDGQSIKINAVINISTHGSAIKINDSTIRYRPYWFTGYDSVMYDIKDSEGAVSNKAYLVIKVNPNPDIPVAKDDSAIAVACDPIYINVLKNDSAQSQDPIEIDTNYKPFLQHALEIKIINDSVIQYRSLPDFAGVDEFQYRIRNKNLPGYTSLSARVKIRVSPNPLVPVALDDSLIYHSFSTDTIDAVDNDIIPPGEQVHIWFVDGAVTPPPVITPEQKVVYQDAVFNLDHQTRTLQYRIRRTDDTSYYSNLAKIKLSYRIDSSCFLARPDTVTIYPHRTVMLNLLKNDYLPNPQDTVILRTVGGGRHLKITGKSDNSCVLTADLYNGGIDTLIYYIGKKGSPIPQSSSAVHVKVINRSFDFLDVNNIKARINSFGNHFFTFSLEGKLGFFAPKNSLKSTLFAGCLWLGGKDSRDSLCFAGERFRQGPTSSTVGKYMDFWAGPVSDSVGYTPEQDSLFQRVWKINKSDIQYHKNHYQDAGYQPIEPIANWPAHGNTAIGQAPNLAPFQDQDNDGRYDPLKGDYPQIYGDQSLFFIYNDDRAFHAETNGNKLSIEVHGWAYAFDYPTDTALNNTFFIHYDIYNRSGATYSDTWMGVFTDFDIGYASDDYLGCDVERNMFFGYNGDSVDGQGEKNAYGDHPPAQSITILSGPVMDPDGIDNPRYDNSGYQLCDGSINGRNFGDGIKDNERYGMRKFLFFNNGGPYSFMSDPSYALSYYSYLQGIWLDGTPMVYGGNGHELAGGYGPECNFMVPGLSDSLDWGTGCLPPNGPKNWTEETAQNTPRDRRGLASMGPFTFNHGDKQQLDLCYTFSRNYVSDDPLASVTLLRENTDVVTKAFVTKTLPDGSSFYGVNSPGVDAASTVNLYPNPVVDMLNIEFSSEIHQNIVLSLTDLEGAEMLSQDLTEGTNRTTLDVSDIPAGFYFLTIRSTGLSVTKKVVIMK